MTRRACQKIKTPTKLSKVVTTSFILGNTSLHSRGLPWLSLTPVREDAINEPVIEEKLTQFVLKFCPLICKPVLFYAPKGSDKFDFTLLWKTLLLLSDIFRLRWFSKILLHKQLHFGSTRGGVLLPSKGRSLCVVEWSKYFAFLPECKFIDLAGFNLDTIYELVHGMEVMYFSWLYLLNSWLMLSSLRGRVHLSSRFFI